VHVRERGSRQPSAPGAHRARRNPLRRRRPDPRGRGVRLSGRRHLARAVRRRPRRGDAGRHADGPRRGDRGAVRPASGDRAGRDGCGRCRARVTGGTLRPLAPAAHHQPEHRRHRPGRRRGPVRCRPGRGRGRQPGHARRAEAAGRDRPGRYLRAEGAGPRAALGGGRGGGADPLVADGPARPPGRHAPRPGRSGAGPRDRPRRGPSGLRPRPAPARPAHRTCRAHRKHGAARKRRLTRPPRGTRPRWPPGWPRWPAAGAAAAGP
jgi:hypothetical protein